MDKLNMALIAEAGLFDGYNQSVFPLESSMTETFSNTASCTAVEHIMNNNDLSFPSNELAFAPWDMMTSKLQMQQAAKAVLSVAMDLTPELSPATRLCTPAANTLQSPFAFDTLGLDELGASPSIGWSSPMDGGFGSQQSQESLDFVTDSSQNSCLWPTQDFPLFPEGSASVISLNQILMAPAPSDMAMSAIEESPNMCKFEQLSPFGSSTASPIVSEYAGLFGDEPCPMVDASSDVDAKRLIAKKRRRRRITSEEGARVIPEGAIDDSEAFVRYKCSICDKTFSRPFNLRSHRATHAGVKPFMCSFVDEKGEACNWSFARRHDLERHMRSRHSGEKQFKCRNCGSGCGRHDAYKRHLQRHPHCAMAVMLEEQQRQQVQPPSSEICTLDV